MICVICPCVWVCDWFSYDPRIRFYELSGFYERGKSELDSKRKVLENRLDIKAARVPIEVSPGHMTAGFSDLSVHSLYWWNRVVSTTERQTLIYVSSNC